MSAAKLIRSALYGKCPEEEIQRRIDWANRGVAVIDMRREIAELQATLFRLDPTPERLTAWADTYAMLPDGEGE